MAYSTVFSVRDITLESSVPLGSAPGRYSPGLFTDSVEVGTKDSRVTYPLLDANAFVETSSECPTAPTGCRRVKA